MSRVQEGFAGRRQPRDGGAPGRWAVELWPLLQAAVAATTAWLIARRIGDHPEPFFAPIAAVVALNATVGQRGLNTLRLLAGVVIGIVVGELTAAVLGGGYGRLAIATFVAMGLARMYSEQRIVIAQAASASILTVIAADGEGGVNRLLDALIGGGVALVFSQLLFSPSPVRLVRRAEERTIGKLAAGLALSARALADDDERLAKQALDSLRGARDQLVEVGQMRTASRRVVRHSLAWRGQRPLVVHENENAGHLDMLGNACLMVMRTSLALDVDGRRRFASWVQRLADSLGELAHAPGSRGARQEAAREVLRLAGDLPGDHAAGSPLGVAVGTLRMAITDVMIFAGVEPEDASDALDAGDDEVPVPAPPDVPKLPFSSDRILRHANDLRRRAHEDD